MRHSTPVNICVPHHIPEHVGGGVCKLSWHKRRQRIEEKDEERDTATDNFACVLFSISSEPILISLRGSDFPPPTPTKLVPTALPIALKYYTAFSIKFRRRRVPAVDYIQGIPSPPPAFTPSRPLPDLFHRCISLTLSAHLPPFPSLPQFQIDGWLTSLLSNCHPRHQHLSPSSFLELKKIYIKKYSLTT